MTYDYDVIILGAGMAGLTAARALAERNQRVLVLEARDRVGGRILTHHVDGQPVELGAEFIHGRAPELWALIDEAGLETTERAGSMLRLGEEERLEEDDDQEEEIFKPLEDPEIQQSPDQSFAAWLAKSDIPADQREALTGYVEGFNAADARIIGMHALGVQQEAEDAIDGERAWHIRGGYAQLAEYLATRVRELRGSLQLNTPARSVIWSAGHATVATATGSITAPRCMVTLPLGVLQQCGITFHPEPAALQQASRLAMGQALRFTMLFRERWWQHSSRASAEELEHMHFLFTGAGTPSVWWTVYPENESHPSLTGWVGGPRTRLLTGKTEDELAHAACTELAHAFGLDTQLALDSLISTHMHNWHDDPYSRGAYSYVPAGALDAPARMCEPEADTLFFAGEHTDTTGHWGTVHAAMRTGLRAAAQILGES